MFPTRLKQPAKALRFFDDVNDRQSQDQESYHEQIVPSCRTAVVAGALQLDFATCLDLVPSALRSQSLASHQQFQTSNTIDCHSTSPFRGVEGVMGNKFNEAELERLSDRIDLEISAASEHLNLLKALVMARDDYYLELNESKTFWHLTLKAHLDSVLTHLCRLFDKSAGALNLVKFLRTVKAHPELFSEKAVRERLKDSPDLETLSDDRAIDDSELDTDIKSVSTSDPLVSRLLEFRSQTISYIDASNVARNSPTVGMTADGIEVLLRRARGIMSKHRLRFWASTYGGIAGAEDYKHTLQLLREGLSSRNAKNWRSD